MLASCGPAPTPQGSSTTVGTLHVAGGLPTSGFLVEANRAGRAAELGIEGISWGRLVDVVDADGILRHPDFVVGEDVRSDDVDFVVDADPMIDRTVVRILHPFASPAYVAALQRAEASLVPVRPKGLGPAEVPPFSVVPRDAALVVRFDDILDPRFVDGAWRDSKGQLLVSESTGQLRSDVIRLVTGIPPSVPHEARVIVSPNHGDVYDFGAGPAFHSTRVIIMPAISEAEALAADPPLEANPLGLPPGTSDREASVALHVPTRVEPGVGQHVILTNPSDGGLAFEGAGARAPISPTRDVVRAFSSGGGHHVNGGRLSDHAPPIVISHAAIELEDDDPGDGIPAVTNLGGGRFLVRQASFQAPVCSAILKEGRDVIEQGVTRARVLSAQQAGGMLQNLLLEVVAPPGGTIVEGAARYQSPYVHGSDPSACFVRFFPDPLTPPDEAVSKSAQLIVRFSKPMDPATFGSFDNLLVTRRRSDSPALTSFDYVVGRVRKADSLREFAFAPVLPLDRSQGFSESDLPSPGTYHFTLLAGPQGPKDLAGNPLHMQALRVPFFLDPAEPVSSNAGLVLRFDSVNEIIFNDDDEAQGWGELRSGQIQFDLPEERILPRPVSRFSVAADRSQTIPSLMSPFPPGLQTPLSPLGSKLQALWRYVDVGFALQDETYTNVDVEGLAWAPIGGGVVSDSYNEFSIRLGHSKWLPDELPHPQTLFPSYPLSGLVKTYAENYLDPVQDPGTIVHPQSRGYVVSPADTFVGVSGTLMQPFPLNRGIPAPQFQHYTWRDTALLGKAASGGAGAILAIESYAVFGGNPPPGTPYAPGTVPTIGLPLLMEYRCYPDSGALGLNAFDVSLAINSSARPNFRAHSTGGFDSSGTPVVKNPDLEDQATGGFGGPTLGTDNVFYLGQMDLVTRVSRTHSLWFDTGFASPKYARPVVEPSPFEQPAGTQVLLAFRGATSVTTGPTSDNIRTNAARLDPYGDPLGSSVGVPTFPPANPQGTWLPSITGIDTNRFFQFRLTFVSNAATSETASLSSLGFAYEE